MARHLWEAMEGESARAFGGFEIYRQLGPNRTVEDAWRRCWSRPGTRRQRGDHTSPPRVMPYFSKWAVLWEWRKRALAWDEEQAAIERDQRLDRELQEKAQEHEEERRQRQLMKEERAGRGQWRDEPCCVSSRGSMAGSWRGSACPSCCSISRRSPIFWRLVRSWIACGKGSPPKSFSTSNGSPLS